MTAIAREDYAYTRFVLNALDGGEFGPQTTALYDGFAQILGREPDYDDLAAFLIAIGKGLQIARLLDLAADGRIALGMQDGELCVGLSALGVIKVKDIPSVPEAQVRLMALMGLWSPSVDEDVWGEV